MVIISTMAVQKDEVGVLEVSSARGTCDLSRSGAAAGAASGAATDSTAEAVSDAAVAATDAGAS